MSAQTLNQRMERCLRTVHSSPPLSSRIPREQCDGDTNTLLWSWKRSACLRLEVRAHQSQRFQTVAAVALLLLRTAATRRST